MKFSLGHHSTIAIVPSVSQEVVWNQVQSVRSQLQDKGLFRWPPHINIIYPFVLPQYYDEILPLLDEKLSNLSPFQITLSAFGTFGGHTRGVLWLDPIASYSSSSSYRDSTTSSSYDIFQSIYDELNHSLLDLGIEPSKKPFRPHMTVSHFPNLFTAEEARLRMQLHWEPVTFEVRELVVMERRGDAGQFHIAWKIPLRGELQSATIPSETTMQTQKTRAFERFSCMLEEEPDWVREMRVESRSEMSGKNSVYKGKRPTGVRKPTTDTAEEIALKRAARAVKKASAINVHEEEESSNV